MRVLDPLVWDIISIGGLILGVLGSLYLSYDLFGREGGPLRWAVRVVTPSLISVAGLSVAGAALYFTYYGWNPRLLQGAALYAIAGLLIGVFNGLYIEPTPLAPGEGLRAVRNALVGGALAFWMGVAAAAILSLPYEALLLEGVVIGLIGAVAAGVWRVMNYNPSATPDRTPRFSTRGFVSGFLSALLLMFAFALITNLAAGTPLGRGALGATRAGALGAIAGGLTGGISQYVYWKALKLPSTYLGGIGGLFTLLGFAVQVVQPVLDAFQRLFQR